MTMFHVSNRLISYVTVYHIDCFLSHCGKLVGLSSCTQLVE